VNGLTMTSSAEREAVESLRSILGDLPTGAEITESEQFSTVLGFLERFIPELLGEIHSEWNHESLDGILRNKTRSIGPTWRRLVRETAITETWTWREGNYLRLIPVRYSSKNS
jgi:hypothetical protein